jgi:hypothetical protein
MTAAPALIALVAPAIDQSVLLALKARTTETIRSTRLLQGCHCYAVAKGYTFLLGDEVLDELWQRQACLKLDSTPGHGGHPWYIRTSLRMKVCLRSLLLNQVAG